jgi:hypothetical protein
MCRIPAPIPSLDEDIRPHFKVSTADKGFFFFFIIEFQDHLLNRRFNQQTLQLDLSNLADDEGKTSKFYLYFKMMK